jgi:UDP-N-acetyl-D-glucosamine dehydrogenase
MKVAIVGLGYVGVPLATAFAEAGQDVIGVDIDAVRVAALASGESDVEDVPSERWAAALARIEPTTSFEGLGEADAIVICVPTPLSANREPELGALTSAAESISGVLRRGQLVVLESTTYPGTTREYVAPLLEESGLAAGRDFHLAFSPERVDPGRTDYTLRTTPKILGGLTEQCAQRARELYGHVCDELVEVSSPEAAELAKLLENIFRSVNIALVNELALLADRMHIDIWEVVDAAATKPYRFMRFDPGPGMGGHCLPVDPFYLSWRARQFDFQTEFIELAGKINQQMPYHCFDRAVRLLNDAGKPVRGSRILLLGISYKAGVGDIRESPALKLMALLAASGAELAYHDPHVPELPMLGLSSSTLEDAALADLVIIVTAHPSVDHDSVAAESQLVLDLRGVTRAADPGGQVTRL